MVYGCEISVLNLLNLLDFLNLHLQAGAIMGMEDFQISHRNDKRDLQLLMVLPDTGSIQIITAKPEIAEYCPEMAFP